MGSERAIRAAEPVRVALPEVVNVDVYDGVRGIVAMTFDVAVETIGPDTHFVDDLHESLELTEIVVRCEEEFGIRVPDDIAETLTTVGRLAEYIASALPADTVTWPPPPSTR